MRICTHAHRDALLAATLCLCSLLAVIAASTLSARPAFAEPHLADAGLSPQAAAALERTGAVTQVKVGGGWLDRSANGRTAGDRKSDVRKIKISLENAGAENGLIRYKVYTSDAGWKSGRDGSAAGSETGSVKAVKAWLRGDVSTRYDVYYRVYLPGYKWLDWAKGPTLAGTTKLGKSIRAIQVKLVKKDSAFTGNTATPKLQNKWKGLEFKYRDDARVRQLLEVKYQGGSNARVVLRKKAGSTWLTALACRGYVGQRGIGKAREGDTKTPKGNFAITSAFGIEDNPGSKIPYVKVNSALYWCADRAYYNQLIDIDEKPHACTGEHLIDYAPHYNYGLFIDYNTNPVRYGRGSAIFFHCTGQAPYTGGCVAVPEAKMKKIIRSLTSGARLCIYAK